MKKRKDKNRTVNNEAATIETAGIKPDIMPDITLDGGAGKKGILKKLLIIPAIAFVVCLAVYIAGVVYYNSHFLKGTVVYGTDVSQMEVEEFEKGLSDYSLKIIQKDKDGQKFEEEFSGEDLGISVSSTDELSDILKKQNAWLWPVRNSAVYSGKPTFISCDDAKVKKVVESLGNMQKDDTTESENAYISGYKKGKGYEIVSEVIGNQLDGDSVAEAVVDVVKSLGDSLDCEEADLYKKPAITSEDKKLNKLLDKLNKYTSTDITYEFGDNTEVLDGDTINKWISVKKNKVRLKEKKISEFVDSLRKKYDTIFGTRDFKTSYGKTITIVGGDYGWWMNTAQEAKELKKLIKKGKQGKRTPCYYQTAESYGEHDYGDTYVEVNLTAQHVILYKDGKMILEADCVTGNSARGFDTPAGVYGITYKQRNATLNGENYSTPVSYWMPFNRNVGLHDADWRTSFGGQIYKSSGSHGCVNLPPDAARRIYDVVEAGTPVICYNLEGSAGGSVKAANKN